MREAAVASVRGRPERRPLTLADCAWAVLVCENYCIVVLMFRTRFATAVAIGYFLAPTATIPALAATARPSLTELEGELMCPTCHTTLDQSDAAIARRIEAFIRVRIAAGDTKQQIIDKLVAQFGPAILAEPTHKGFDLLAWW